MPSKISRNASIEEKTAFYALRVTEKHGGKVALISPYTRSKDKHTFKCTEGHTWKATYDSVSRVSGCPYCRKNSPKSAEQALKLLKQQHGDSIAFNAPEYINMSTPICFTCTQGHDSHQL